MSLEYEPSSELSPPLLGEYDIATVHRVQGAGLGLGCGARGSGVLCSGAGAPTYRIKFRGFDRDCPDSFRGQGSGFFKSRVFPKHVFTRLCF